MHRERGVVVASSGLVLCAWCGWVSGFHRSTTPAVVTWAFSLAAVVVVDLWLWQGQRGRKPGLRLEPVGEPWPRRGRGGSSPGAGGSLALARTGPRGAGLGDPRNRHGQSRTASDNKRTHPSISTFERSHAVGVDAGWARLRGGACKGPRSGSPLFFLSTRSREKSTPSFPDVYARTGDDACAASSVQSAGRCGFLVGHRGRHRARRSCCSPLRRSTGQRRRVPTAHHHPAGCKRPTRSGMGVCGVSPLCPLIRQPGDSRAQQVSSELALKTARDCRRVGRGLGLSWSRP